jgi:predicted dehydrogenase
MTEQHRRDFLKQAGLATAVACAGSASAGADDRVVVAVIGTGGMGSNHARVLAGRKDVAVAYVCDPDAGRLAAAAKAVADASGREPKAVKDLRQVLEDKTVDAVWVAMPDHWHGPAAILACEAGKHVYVEKPCAHNVREGRLMVEAARRHKRVMQVGTQSRSAEHVLKAMQALREGVIGDVVVAKAWNSQRRGNIGHAKPSKPPAELDYDLWVGPAPLVPYQDNRGHYNWHWWYDFGTGDMGNDGVHDIDIARWGLGVETHPTAVASLGGKYVFDDDQQFPDTQYVVFEYASDGRVGQRKQLIYEHRIWSPYFQEGYENGNAFYGTKGMMVLGKGGGWKVILEGNKAGPSMTGSSGLPPHHGNFLECIRSGKQPNADIEIGHLSAALCHLGNLATRLGRTLRFDPKTEQFLGDAEASKLVKRTYRPGHWAVPKGV